MLSRLVVGEYTITQAFSYDVSIFKDGKMVLHAIRHERCSEEELLEILEAFKEMQKKGII